PQWYSRQELDTDLLSSVLKELRPD
ncbi:hypothetical protein PI125_g26577, partial [Phytophthora idaei]